MYIIFSPAKLMNLEDSLNVKENYVFKGEVEHLLNYFYEMDIDQIKSTFKLKSAQLALETHKYYHSFNCRKHPLWLYNGQSYKQLELSSYQEPEFEYLNQHLRIISALYGVLKPFDVIFPYRLDFNTKIEINLVKYWSEIINLYLSDTECIVNLASKEFSQLVKHPKMTNIVFKQAANGKYVSQSTRCKQARGKYLNWMVQNKITVNQLTEFTEDDYYYDQNLSDEMNLVFVKEY